MISGNAAISDKISCDNSPSRASDISPTSNEKNVAFPPLPPPCNFVLVFELNTVGNNQYPNFERRGGGGGEGGVPIVFSMNYPFDDIV